MQLALEALAASDYPHVVTLVNESIEQGISWEAGRAEALNLRGTFKFVNLYKRYQMASKCRIRFLTGDVEEAKTDFQESIKILPSFTQSLVKVASVHMEQGNPGKAFECFDAAIKENPKDPDIYYHRGQGMNKDYLWSPWINLFSL